MMLAGIRGVPGKRVCMRQHGGPLQIKNTIKRDLIVLWAFIAFIALLLSSLLFQLSRQGASSQISSATRQVALSCEAIRAGAAAGHPVGEQMLPRATMQAAIDLALREQAGVEGGFWQPSQGVLAYAFPTYDGSGIKRDAPSAELERIAATAQRALDSDGLVTDVRPGLREAVLFAACPVGRGPAPIAAWTLRRVPLMSAVVLDQLLLSTGVLLAFVVLSGGWLGWTLSRWRRHSSELMTQLSHAERLATLGRVAAGMAHEIRNPIGTMRMKAENALAAPPEVREARIAGALKAVLTQTERLETLVSSLLALAQPFQIHRQSVNLLSWLEERCLAHRELAQREGISIRMAIDSASFAKGMNTNAMDPGQMARALDNLLLNALAHCTRGGEIEVGVRHLPGDRLLLWVADDGPGVPRELRDTLFDPFVGSRPGGSGLGLALVRELVQAHAGTIVLAQSAGGARFEMELPWHTS